MNTIGYSKTNIGDWVFTKRNIFKVRYTRPEKKEAQKLAELEQIRISKNKNFGKEALERGTVCVICDTKKLIPSDISSIINKGCCKSCSFYLEGKFDTIETSHTLCYEDMKELVTNHHWEFSDFDQHMVKILYEYIQGRDKNLD